MRAWIVIAGIFGAAGVAVAALSAHAVTPDQVYRAELLDKASRFALWHALALGLVGVLAHQGLGGRLLTVAGVAFSAGVVLFCGALITLAFGWPTAMVTPFGGSAFIIGWLALALVGLRATKSQ